MGNEMQKKQNNNRTIGTVYENKAVLFLQKQGYEILHQNYYSVHGEIDIIAKQASCIVFVEVKYRKKNSEYDAIHAITPKKQQHIRYTAKRYLMQRYHSLDVFCRFDVLAFDGEQITHIENAF